MPLIITISYYIYYRLITSSYLPSDDSSGIFVTWKVVANDDFLRDQKLNKKHYLFTGNHIEEQMLSAPAGTNLGTLCTLYHQLAHGYIYEQLNLVAPGTCDVSNGILASHR